MARGSGNHEGMTVSQCRILDYVQSNLGGKHSFIRLKLSRNSQPDTCNIPSISEEQEHFNFNDETENFITDLEVKVIVVIEHNFFKFVSVPNMLHFYLSA